MDSLYNAEGTIEKRIEAYAKEIVDDADNTEALDRLYKYVSIYTSIYALKMNEAARGLVAQMTDAVHNIDVEDLKKAGIYVRHFRKPERISEYLRMTIGTDKQMETLISCLEILVNKAKSE